MFFLNSRAISSNFVTRPKGIVINNVGALTADQFAVYCNWLDCLCVLLMPMTDAYDLSEMD